MFTAWRIRLLPGLLSGRRAMVRFVPPVSGSEITCELEFTIPEDDRFFDDKVHAVLANFAARNSASETARCAALLRALAVARPAGRLCCQTVCL